MDFSLEILQAGREQREIFKVLRESAQHKILYLGNSSSKHEGQIDFLMETKTEEMHGRRPVLPEMLSVWGEII